KPELKSFHFPYKSFLYCFTGSHLDSTLKFCRRHIYLLCPCKLCLQWLVIRYFNHLHKSKLLSRSGCLKYHFSLLLFPTFQCTQEI
uniref:Uncharacterized protein n=1 Tax=Lynx canadensis TaxID=61383 RepID=A0A667ITW4_LYNCA